MIQSKKNIDSIEDFLNPNYVYVPIDDETKVNVTNDKYIYKNDVLVNRKNKKIFSPISGMVLGKTDNMHVHSNKVSCMVIENDFKEKVKKRTGVKKYINEYKETEFFSLMAKYFYKSIDESVYKTLLITGLDYDPFECTNSTLINVFPTKILEAIDAIGTILNIEKQIIVIDNKNSSNVVSLTNNLGTYPDIKLKLINNNYPLSRNDLLVKHIFGKRVNDSELLLLNISELLDIYYILKRGKPITDKYITLGGNVLKETKVVRVKIGMNLGDLIRNQKFTTRKKYFIVVNGIIGGKTLIDENELMTADIRSVFISTLDDSKEKPCINCGLCSKKCPVGLNPRFIMEHKNAPKDKCIHCGLCTYICPSKINFKKYLGE